MLAAFLGWLGSTRIALLIAESPSIFPWLEVIHVVGIAILLGTIAVIDLRLTALAGREFALHRLTRTLLPISWTGFLIALCSGSLMFTSQPELYWDNWYFRAKMVLLLLAGANMAAFHLFTGRGMKDWDANGSIPVTARLAGAASLALWVLVVAAGRWIGFTMSPF